MYATDEEDYNIKKQQLFDATNAEFRKYFLENWESCVEMWATFKRDQYMHFGNTTNNRLESHNQKLKDVTSRTSTLSEMFNNVVLFAQMCESEYKHSTFNEEFKIMKSSSHQSIEGCSEVEVIYTQYASNKISEQMKLATSVKYVFSQREGIVEVTSPTNQCTLSNLVMISHALVLSTKQCSCHAVISLLQGVFYNYHYFNSVWYHSIG